MISRRRFVGLFSAVSLVNRTLMPFCSELPADGTSEPNEEVWVRFTHDLADALWLLDEGEFLIITTEKNHYVQFAEGARGMRVEAISNTYTDDSNRLSEGACTQLLQMGWNAPTYVWDEPHPGRNDPRKSPNYFVDIDVPVPYGSVASLAVSTFDAYCRYMTAILTWAGQKHWTTTQVEASLMDSFEVGAPTAKACGAGQ